MKRIKEIYKDRQKVKKPCYEQAIIKQESKIFDGDSSSLSFTESSLEDDEEALKFQLNKPSNVPRRSLMVTSPKNKLHEVLLKRQDQKSFLSPINDNTFIRRGTILENKLQRSRSRSFNNHVEDSSLFYESNNKESLKSKAFYRY